MKSKVIVLALAVMCVGAFSMEALERGPRVDGIAEAPAEVRTNGTLGPVTSTITQTGALQADVGVFASTTGGSAFTANEAALVYGQIYDYPWAGGTPANTFVSGSITLQYATAMAPNYGMTWTFTVPVANEFQSFGLVYVGFANSTTGGQTGYFFFSQYGLTYGPTTYVDSTVPPTATPDPNAGGIPVPSMNQWGVMAMIVLLIGVAMLIITRRQ